MVFTLRPATSTRFVAIKLLKNKITPTTMVDTFGVKFEPDSLKIVAV